MKLPTDKDFAYEMTPLKIVSWPVGTWPLQKYDLLSVMRSVVTLVVLTVLFFTVHMEIYLDHGNAEKNLDAVLLITCSMLAISKVACFRFRPTGLIANFVSAVRDHQDLREEKKRAIVKHYALMGRITSASILSCSYASALLFMLVPLFTGTEDATEILNHTAYKCEHSLPFPSECTLELLRMPENVHGLIYLGEFLMLVLLACGNMGSDILFFGIAFHLCGQVEVLKLDFSRFLEYGTDSGKRFNALVMRHRHLLTLAEHLNNTIGYILVLQLFSSCMLICISGVQFILSLQVHNIVMVIKTFVVVSVLLSQMFAYSYVGEYSRNQFGAIGYLAYCSDWYNAPCNLSRNVMFVLMKTQYPVHLKAGRFFLVNLQTYMSILKTSMSYLSVLRVMVM
ncbi:odorant receptor 10-like [Megalopta genalis]|uniref:odorant receptor 10-like n=1 Tax=Megalopta genalis TaxID=115081 RepID=UPI003FD2C163